MFLIWNKQSDAYLSDIFLNFSDIWHFFQNLYFSQMSSTRGMASTGCLVQVRDNLTLQLLFTFIQNEARRLHKIEKGYLVVSFSVFMWRESRSVMSDSLWPHGWYSPWNSPGLNTGVDSRSILQGIFPTQGSNFEPRFPLLQVDSLPAEPPGKWWTSRVHEKMKLKTKPKLRICVIWNLGPWRAKCQNSLNFWILWFRKFVYFLDRLTNTCVTTL